MRENIHPILFLDDWPAPPSSDGRTCSSAEEDHIGPGMNNMRKWRIQTLLAVNPWGIPVMAFKKAYERMFPGKKFEPKDHGYENTSSMVYDLPDIFAVQEPDDVTALMFPDYPHDRILHDARLGHEFAPPNHCHHSSCGGQRTCASYFDPSGQQQPGHNELVSAIDGQQQLATGRWGLSAIQDGNCRALATGNKSVNAINGLKTIDPDILISYAWIHRDTDFPADVVLAGEQYSELILPLTSANIPGTRGVHQAIIVGVATPDSFYINVKTADRARVETLTRDIYQFFAKLGHNIDSYNLPDEFIYPGFPCLVYSKEFKCWERCVIVSRSTRRTNRVLVQYVDFGGSITVNRIYLYLMPRRFLDIPKQAILCSLMGLRPKPGDKWSRSISCRMRFFSQPRYWLDVLLVEPKTGLVIGSDGASKASSAAAVAIEDKSTSVGPTVACNDATNDTGRTTTNAEAASLSTSFAAAAINTQTSGQQYEGPARASPDEGKCKRKKRVLERKLDYKTIICDRFDGHGFMDVFLDEILVMEEYASFDTDCIEEFNSLKNAFKEALSTLPRPRNPFSVFGKSFWPADKLTDTVPEDCPSVEVKYEDDDS